MNALIPVLSKNFSDRNFLQKISEKSVLVLIIADSKAEKGHGFLPEELSAATALQKEIIAVLLEKKKGCTDILEWGETNHKTINIALLNKPVKVYLVSGDSPDYFSLTEELKKNKVLFEEFFTENKNT
jgi:hypothetical protein